jgi:uncharacterized membrane protein YqhA
MQPEIDSALASTTGDLAPSPAPTPALTPTPPQSPDELPTLHGADTLVGVVLSSGRYFILLAIVGSFVTSCAVLLYAFFVGVVDSFSEAVRHEFDAEGAKHVSVEVISLVDLFLLGTVLYVVSVGLYQLFINPRLPTPRWLKIDDLDDLKERLLATIVVLLAVSFLGYVVTWDGTVAVLAVGAAIGVVLVAISLLLRQFRGSSRQDG